MRQFLLSIVAGPSVSMRTVLVTFLLILVSACTGRAGRSAPSRPAPETSCWTLATVTGPEDFVVDRSQGTPRLLVSSRNIDDPSTRDGIDAVTLDGAGRTLPARRLYLADRDDCSFHPHGISLVRGELNADGAPGRPWLLYVINHHDEREASPAAGCVKGAEPGTRPVSVEVFRVGASELTFVQRLAAPAVLTHANDLVALSDGEVWITNPPPTSLGVLRESLFGHGDSKVVHFDCDHLDETTLRCPDTAESWSVAWDGGRFVNGIAYAEGADGASDHLYVASSLGQAIHRFRVAEDGTLTEEDPPIDVDGMPDNLTWLGPGHRTLLAALHPDRRRFLQHSVRHHVRSPSRVVAVDLLASSGTANAPVIFDDDGRLVSAASTAACVDGDLILGQVYGAHVLRCQAVPECRTTPRTDGAGKEPPP